MTYSAKYFDALAAEVVMIRETGNSKVTVCERKLNHGSRRLCRRQFLKFLARPVGCWAGLATHSYEVPSYSYLCIVGMKPKYATSEFLVHFIRRILLRVSKNIHIQRSTRFRVDFFLSVAKFSYFAICRKLPPGTISRKISTSCIKKIGEYFT